MLFYILVEDQSGKTALKILIPKIVGEHHQRKFRKYKGKRPPKRPKPNDNLRTYLLNDLPERLRAYGATYPDNSPNPPAAVVIVVCDLDKDCLKTFRAKLDDVLDQCDPKPVARFCIAIQEMEAWFLGDREAVKQAYPKANSSVLDRYKDEGIYGTWERLADAIYPGGSGALSKQNHSFIGTRKSEWAETISQYMDPDNNVSPSFNYFRRTLKELIRN